MQAALGGRRTSGKLTCEDCQKRFGDGLDTILPAQLRYFSTAIGVAGDHTGKTPVMAIVEDRATGTKYRLDEFQNFHSSEPTEIELGVSEDGKTVYKHFSVVGERAQKDLLKRLKKSGHEFTVERVEIKGFLQQRPLWSGISVGGEEAFRAIGRLALNVLCHIRPEVARAPGLEAFKRWVYDGSGGSEYCHFAERMPEGTFPSSPFSFGHRILFGFSETGLAFARISFFDAYEFALRLGTIDNAPSKLLIADFDPLAQHQAPDYDFKLTEIESLPLEVLRIGDFAKSQDAVIANNQRRAAQMLAVARDRAWSHLMKQFLPQLNKANPLEGIGRRDAINNAVEPLRQVAFNLWAKGAEYAAEAYKEAGAERHAEFIRDIPQQTKLAELGAQMVLWGLAQKFDEMLRLGPISGEAARDLLDGNVGLTIAVDVLLNVLASTPLIA